MANIRRTNAEVVRISCTISPENKALLERESLRRGVSVSALLDNILTAFKRKVC